CYVCPLRFLCVLLFPRSPSSILFPYTTLFRSLCAAESCTRMRAWSRGTTGKLNAVTNTPRSSISSVIRVARMTDEMQERGVFVRSEEHTSELQSRFDLVCRLLLEPKNK